MIKLTAAIDRAKFLDRDLANALAPGQRRFLAIVGSDLRRGGRRNLKRAKQTKVSDLTPEQRERWERQKALFAAGKLLEKPRRPDVSAKPGEPARTHSKPSALRDGATGILYALNEDNSGVVSGPSPYGDNMAQKLEQKFPFMSPAFEKVRPTIPNTLRRTTAV